ncbi:protein FAM124B-like [Ascaphus truei]|uniref:protein FAM124B-like n=1 Tax=Ascaphus truei TaxID=8439 RepID=UPI003F59BA6E
MDTRQIVLPLTVHLLTSSGNSFALQQAVEQLLNRICPDVRLFHVSPRAAPTIQYEFHKKRLEFPGISVTLFLREDMGEKRISHMHGFFHLPPWNYVHPEPNQGKHCPTNQTDDTFYSLDSHMPVWGIRQVHYGTEIVRLTLYCSFDNYEDAVRLYEMILQIEGTAQKAGFCFFVLHSTKDVSVELSLKQLPPGMSVEVKDGCALQFMVQAIGQLVPLLPYPCVPISDTRWQTQDYDGNKILLLVNGSTSEIQGLSDSRAAQESRVNPGTPHPLSFRKLTNRLETEGQILFDNLKFKQASSISNDTSDQSETSRGMPVGDSSNTQQKLMPRHYLQVKKTETNVDTGDAVMSLEGQQDCICRFARDLQNIPACGHCHFSGADCRDSLLLPSEQGDSPSSNAVKRNKCFGMGTMAFQLQRSQAHHSNSKEEEEEFFI